MFECLFLEEQVLENKYAKRILNAFPEIPVRTIRKVEDVFGRVKKPYLQKRKSLNLFVGRKEGKLVKEAPDAYGLEGEPHFYFIHAYNCIYECEYCYLQGYFNSPDLVFYVNHDEIVEEMKNVVSENSSAKRVWFHAGEFSDSLALSHITREWQVYWSFLEETPTAIMELRTKSVNIKSILQLSPLENIVISFSLSPSEALRRYDHKTPSLKGRLKAIGELAEKGYKVALHLDPIIDMETLDGDYKLLIDEVKRVVKQDQIEYISLGVVRFTRDVYQQFKRNYPDSKLQAAEFVTSFDNKVRYSRPHRLNILNRVKNICLSAGFDENKVYLCMEY